MSDRPRAAPRFERKFFGAAEAFTCIGSGSAGGKASGLLQIKDVFAARLPPEACAPFTVEIPTLTVIATDAFDRFVRENGLGDVVGSDAPDGRIAHAFQHATLPSDLVGDLRALIEQVHTPLAVRSSSLLEDALFHPFAGVYGTKMIPNNQPDVDTRFHKLVEAVKFVYASTYFRSAKSYIKAAGCGADDEKMAVVIQEVVGHRFAGRLYPHVSGVAKSFSFYRSGSARPEDGSVSLALGLGKTIVEGGVVWTYAPADPRQTPPFASAADQLKRTQTEFWAVNMGRPPAYDPTAETEYLVKANVADADFDGALTLVASTYDARADRLVAGTGRAGPRVVTFAPLLVLEELPLNRVIRSLLAVCEDALQAPVEIEFAVTLPASRGAAEPPRIGFLQVRPMVVSDQVVVIEPEEMVGPRVLLASDEVLGNGVVETMRDIVFVKPETFETRHTREMAGEIADMNRALLDEGRPYLLIGFGRWGSSDPSLGIPADWGHICGARAIVEATRPGITVELSQGSHFFHNISSFRVSYFSTRPHIGYDVDWAWLSGQSIVRDAAFVRHVRLAAPLTVKVDGRSGRGVILKPA